MRRYTDETKRLYDTLEAELSDGREWLVGNTVTLADLAQFPWVAGAAWAGEHAFLPEIHAFVSLLAHLTTRTVLCTCNMHADAVHSCHVNPNSRPHVRHGLRICQFHLHSRHDSPHNL